MINAPTEFIPVEYTKEEITYRQRMIDLISAARDEREKKHEEFDDMSFSQFYLQNKRLDNAYLREKKHKTDVRITSGATRQKDTFIVSQLLKFNFEPNVMAFNKDGFAISELGTEMQDLIKKSKEIENYDYKRSDIYRELVTQGIVCVEDIYNEVYEPKHVGGDNWEPTQEISKADYKTLYEVKGELEYRQIPAVNVYFGNIYQPWYMEQPYYYTYEEVPRSLAEKVFGKWSRWKHVPTGSPQMQAEYQYFSQGAPLVYKDYFFNKNIDAQKVGIVKFRDIANKTYQIMINGVLMLPINYPLSKITPNPRGNLSWAVFESIPNFFYGKGVPANTKVSQAVYDEFIVMMIEKTRQSYKPTLANRTKRVLPDTIFQAGQIVDDVNPNDLTPIFQSTGVTASEFSMTEFIRQQLDDQSVNRAATGEDAGGQKTATQFLEEKKNQLLKLGMGFDGVVNLEHQLAWNRIYSICEYYTKPTAQTYNPDTKLIENIYRNMLLDNVTFPTGESGMKYIKFTDKPYPNVRTLMSEEDKMTEEQGKPVRMTLIDPDTLLRLKKIWYVKIVPTEKDSNEFNQVMFINNLKTLIEFFGVNPSMNDYLKQRYATLIKEDYSKLFPETQNSLEMLQQQMQGIGNPSVSKEINGVQQGLIPKISGQMK